MIYTNCVTTDSPTYALEVLDGGAAGCFRGTLGRSEIRSKMHGILNGTALLSVSRRDRWAWVSGIDMDEWNLSSDIFLSASFSAASPEGKAICKEYLQKVRGYLFVDLLWEKII